MSFTQLGFFTGIYGLLAMLLSVPAGLDRASASARSACSRRASSASRSAACCSARAWNFESAVAFRGLTIFGYRFAFVSVLIAVALTAPPRLRGRTMGVLGATSAMASVIGAPLGGALVGEFGLAQRDPGLRVDGAARRRRVLAVLSRDRGARCSAPVAASAAHARRAPRSAFRSPVVWLLALVVGLGGFGQFTVTYFVPSVADARLRSRRRSRRRHHQHGLHRRDRSESRHRRARRSLQQARRARRDRRRARRRVGVVGDRARARVSCRPRPS